jgi:hypothetical protein
MARLPARRLALCFLVFMVGCSDSRSAQDSAFAFPTVPRSEDYPAGDIQGSLVIEDSCLVLDTGRERYLLLWPEGYEYAADSMEVIGDGGVVASLEDPVTLGGGERSLGAALSSVQGDIPRRCQVGRYWLVSP